MKLGFALPTFPFSFPLGTSNQQPLAVRTIAYARTAEEVGFHQVWVPDHLWIDVAPPGVVLPLQQPPECWTMLAALAATTRTIRLGSLVTPVGFRNFALLSHTVGTVQQLAGGRLEIGLGAGWNAAEFTKAELPFPPAKKRLDALRAAVELLRTGQHPPAVWVGGKRPRLLDVAATADGWNMAWTVTRESYATLTRVFDEACRGRDRDPQSVRRSLGLVALVGSSDGDLAERWRMLQRWAPGGALDGTRLEEWARSLGRYPRSDPGSTSRLGRCWRGTGHLRLRCSLRDLPGRAARADG